MREKVVLLNIGSDYPRWEEQFLTLPPAGILALGSYLAAQDVPVEVIDVQMDFGFGLTTAAERTVGRRVARYLLGQKDSLAWVGISQISNTASGVVLAEEVHAALPDTPILFGGYFPTCSYELLLRKYPFITAIVRGDGEAAALEITRSLAHGQPFLSDRTPNLAWLDAEGRLHTTPMRPMDLSKLPILDFRLLHNRNCYQTGSLITSRGCPFHCSYCTEAGMRPYAAYPAEWLEQQLVHLEAELQYRHAIIADPIFGAGRGRTRELCRVMSQHGFFYAAETRVDVLPPDLIPLLHQAGIELLFWGIESASPSTLLRMNKVRSEAEAEKYLQHALTVLRACFEHNIVPELGMMVGFPGDTEADLQASLEFVRKVEQLHDQVAAETGVETGFLSFSQRTQIYDSTPLAGRLSKEFQAQLGEETFDGERTVLSPSPDLSLETVQQYEAAINSFGRYVPKVLEVNEHYISFSGGNFIQEHPELVDAEGVIVLSDQVQRLSA